MIRPPPGYRVIQRISGGSDRCFYRARRGDGSCVILDDPAAGTYAQLLRHLSAHGVSVPEVVEAQDGLLIMTDAGDRSLFSHVVEHGVAPDLYHRVIDELLVLQVAARPDAPVVDHYDAAHQQWEQDYFVRCYLRQQVHVDATAATALVEEFAGLRKRIQRLIAPIRDYLMHRDYQSRNILLSDDRIVIIDVQSARIGPLTYDIASLLRDAYVDIGHEMEQELLAYYRGQLAARGIHLSAWQLADMYEATAVQRSMQVLGAFSNLSLNKGKPEFARYLPRALELLRRGVKRIHLPRLESLLDSLSTT